MKYMKITKKCANCGNDVIRSPSLMKGINVFCNRKCQKEYYQKNAKTGENSPGWKGGRRITEYGYIRIRMPNHPRAVSGYVLEHIIVMEQKLGRPLKEGERVHHINHNPADNRQENLKLYSSNGQHLAEEGHHRKKHPPCPCGRPHKGQGLCARHLAQLRETGKTWDFENKLIRKNRPKLCHCGQPVKCRDLCNKHYQQWRNKNKGTNIGYGYTLNVT